tara:strand:+ start:3608 stop:3955 length:348 start_codon:yes stop_codon:yes gene_type:complete
MNSEEKGDSHKIRVSTLKAVYNPIASYLHKIEALIEDHYREGYLLQPNSIVTLMELKISCNVVSSYLEDLFDQAEEADVEHLFLTSVEIKMISSIATSVASAASFPIENTNLMDH